MLLKNPFSRFLKDGKLFNESWGAFCGSKKKKTERTLFTGSTNGARMSNILILPGKDGGMEK